MTTEQVFNIQTLYSLIVFGTVAVWYVWPKFKTMSHYDCLTFLLVLAAFRYLGTSFMVPTATAGLAPEFGNFGGLADLTVSSIALIGAYALHFKQSWGVLFAWLYAILGSADFIYNGAIAGNLGVADHIGPLMWLMSVGGPFWMVGLALLWRLLIKPVNHGKAPSASALRVG